MVCTTAGFASLVAEVGIEMDEDFVSGVALEQLGTLVRTMAFARRAIVLSGQSKKTACIFMQAAVVFTCDYPAKPANCCALTV